MRLSARVAGASSMWPRGFTLVELLIAATMMSILFVGLGAHLRGGIAVWRRTIAAGETVQRRHVALERLEQELANAIVYDDREASYGEGEGALPRPRFEETQLAWFSVAPAGRRPMPAVRFVTYECAQRDGVQGLWRTSQFVGDARARTAPSPQLALPECEQLSLRYAVLPDDPAEPPAWRSQWAEPHRGLPRLLEVTMRFASGERLTRVMGIPSGRSAAPGSPP